MFEDAFKLITIVVIFAIVHLLIIAPGKTMRGEAKNDREQMIGFIGFFIWTMALVTLNLRL